MLFRRLGVLVVIAMFGCGGPLEVCTLIGCNDALIVELRGNVPATFTLTVEGGSPGPWVMECTPANCGGAVQFDSFTPDRVRVRIEVAGTVLFEEVFEPVYQVVQPNGVGCPPVCEIGRISIELS